MSSEAEVPLPRPGDDLPGAPPPLRGARPPEDAPAIRPAAAPVEEPRVKAAPTARGDSGAIGAPADRRTPVLVAGVVLAAAAGFLAARRLRRARTP